LGGPKELQASQAQRMRRETIRRLIGEATSAIAFGYRSCR
jgi:hypothetical protein